ERVESALLTLGHEQAVDSEHRREQQRDGEHRRGELPVDRGPVETKVKNHERDDREQHHRGQRLEPAQREQQALAQADPCRLHADSAASLAESSCAGSPTNAVRPCLSASTRSASARAAWGSWLVSTRVTPADRPISGSTSSLAAGSRLARGSSSSSNFGLWSTARQTARRCTIPRES